MHLISLVEFHTYFFYENDAFILCCCVVNPDRCTVLIKMLKHFANRAMDNVLSQFFCFANHMYFVRNHAINYGTQSVIDKTGLSLIEPLNLLWY